jgi:hypothetical protein
MILIAASAPFVPVGAILGAPKAGTVLPGLVALVLAAPPIVAFQMLLVTAFAGSADAAMNRIMLLTVVLTGIGALTVSGTPTVLFVFGVPIVAAVALMGEILLGQAPSLEAGALALIGSAGTLVLALWLVTRLYEREAIMRV